MKKKTEIKTNRAACQPTWCDTKRMRSQFHKPRTARTLSHDFLSRKTLEDKIAIEFSASSASNQSKSKL